MSPFDYVKSVWNTKQYLNDNRELFNKSYTPFIVNKALSNSEVGVLFANEMNKYFSLEKDMQYDFYFHGVPKQRSYLKWVKKTAVEDDVEFVEFVATLYGVSQQRAVEYLSLMSDESIDKIKQLKGGKK